MGGFGSGRWYRHGTRPLAEYCLQLDINKLKRDDLLRPGLRYSVHWESSTNIGIATFHDEIEHSYTINCDEEDDEEHIGELVFLERTPCNFGATATGFSAQASTVAGG